MAQIITCVPQDQVTLPQSSTPSTHTNNTGLDVPTPAPPQVSRRVGVARTPLLPTVMLALRPLHAVLALLLGVQAQHLARHHPTSRAVDRVSLEIIIYWSI